MDIGHSGVRWRWRGGGVHNMQVLCRICAGAQRKLFWLMVMVVVVVLGLDGGSCKVRGSVTGVIPSCIGISYSKYK